MFLKKNLLWFVVFAIVLFFFSQTFLFTWKTAAPYCRADDWRFIDIYLRPFYNGQFRLSDLWADGVHPLPVYAIFFISSAKYFNLQIHYIARVAIFSQLMLGLLISYSFTKSLKSLKSNEFILITALISINSIVFSFIVQTPYAWPIMTSLFLGSFIIVLLGHFTDLYFNQKKILNDRFLAIIGSLIIISFLLFNDWTLIFSFSIFFILILIFILEKDERYKITKLSITLIISLVISSLLLSIFLKESSRNLHYSLSGIFYLIKDYPILSLKSVSIGMLSGILNYKYFVETMGISQNIYTVVSMVFMILYICVFIVYFIKKLYKKSILPPILMIYSLVFILSVFIFRYNPIDNGEFCLVIPRYIQYYQIGIVGFLWSLFLILNTIQIKPKQINIIKIAGSIITILLIAFWINDYFLQIKISGYLNKKYPEVSNNIREKLNNNTIEIPWSIQPHREIEQQLQFLKDHKLNIFAPNYPYIGTTEDAKLTK